MGSIFENVLVNKILENGTTVNHIQGKVQLRLSYDPAGISVKVFQGKLGDELGVLQLHP